MGTRSVLKNRMGRGHRADIATNRPNWPSGLIGETYLICKSSVFLPFLQNALELRFVGKIEKFMKRSINLELSSVIINQTFSTAAGGNFMQGFYALNPNIACVCICIFLLASN